MSAPANYPTGCLSFYCGRILCDGCDRRPILAECYRKAGRLAEYEERQDRARELAARLDAERAARVAP